MTRYPKIIAVPLSIRSTNSAPVNIKSNGVILLLKQEKASTKKQLFGLFLKRNGAREEIQTKTWRWVFDMEITALNAGKQLGRKSPGPFNRQPPAAQLFRAKAFGCKKILTRLD